MGWHASTIKVASFACVLWLAAGEAICGGLGSGIPAFPRLMGAEGLKVSASAHVSLAWMQEGERRRYFPELAPGSLLLRLDCEQDLLAANKPSEVKVRLEPEGPLEKASLSVSGAEGEFSMRPIPGGLFISLGKGASVRLSSWRLVSLAARPAGVKPGAGKASYHLELDLEAGPTQACGPLLELDLGRRVPARLIKTEPPQLEFKRLQSLSWCLPVAQSRAVSFDISDAVLKAYPPLTLKQREASQRLVEDLARALGRKP